MFSKFVPVASLLLALSNLVHGQCKGSSVEITGRVGEILSPNYQTGTEYGVKAKCSWGFSPPSDGKEYALVVTVKELILYTTDKSAKSHCLGSYNLTINQDQIRCDRFAGSIVTRSSSRGDEIDIKTTTFCKAYYGSPACVGIVQNRSCETLQQTSYPISVKYVSDGRRNARMISLTIMHFKIGHEFFECSNDATIVNSTVVVLVVVAVIVILIVLGEVGVFLYWKRANTPSPDDIQLHEARGGIYANDPSPSNQEKVTTPPQKDSQLFQESRCGIYDNDPSLSNQEKANALPQKDSQLLQESCCGIYANEPSPSNQEKAGTPLQKDSQLLQGSRDGIYVNDPLPSNKGNQAYGEIYDDSDYEAMKPQENSYLTPIEQQNSGGECEVIKPSTANVYENEA